MTHGYYTPTRKVSSTALFFESKQYNVNTETGYIDYDALEKSA